jgi:hypothetical protein
VVVVVTRLGDIGLHTKLHRLGRDNARRRWNGRQQGPCNREGDGNVSHGFLLGREPPDTSITDSRDGSTDDKIDTPMNTCAETRGPFD